LLVVGKVLLGETRKDVIGNTPQRLDKRKAMS
jgi:hypothetical protein